MNYVDSMLVQLASPATRGTVFDEASLRQMLRAAYDAGGMNLQPPFSAVFDEFRLGLAVPKLGVLEGYWAPLGGGERVEARFQFSGADAGNAIRVDAYWRGAIVGRISIATARIAEVAVSRPDAEGIDEEIVTALGALPVDPQALEQERRTRLISRLKAATTQPDAVTSGAFDSLLAELDASSAGELMERLKSASSLGVVRITYSQAPPPPLSPRPLPLAAAILIRDSGFSLAELLVDSKTVREQLEPLGLGRPEDPSLRMRHPLLIAWIVPASIFDDDAWPGTDRDARRAVAEEWLAREGIGLVATP